MKKTCRVLKLFLQLYLNSLVSLLRSGKNILIIKKYDKVLFGSKKVILNFVSFCETIGIGRGEILTSRDSQLVIVTISELISCIKYKVDRNLRQSIILLLKKR